MSKSITNKLILALTLSLAAILAVGMTVDYQLSRDEILKRLSKESQETVADVVNDLEHWLHGVEGSTLLLSRILEHRQYTPDGLNEILKDIVTHNDDIYGATIALNPDFSEQTTGFAPYYYHSEGRIIYANLTQQSEPYWQEPWYEDAVAAGKPVWVEPYFDNGGGNVLMTTFSVPVYHYGNEGNRQLYGVVTADVALKKLHYYLQRLQLGYSGHGMLISKAGTILSAENNDSVMRHYLDVASDTPNKDTWHNSFTSAVRGESRVLPIQCLNGNKGCELRLSVLTSTGWLVGIIYSPDEMLAPLKEYQIKTVLISIATLLMMVLAISLVSRRLTGPLVALAKASNDIAQGELNTPLPRVKGEDEIALLVQSFGAMKRDLKTYITDLEIATAGRSRLEGELAAARDIQMAMLPQGGEALVSKPHYSLWAKVKPAKSVGGDLYTFYHQDDNTLFIAVGDVSDKGVPAALFMAKAMSHIQQFSEAFESPSQGMAALNNALELGNDNCMFLTLFFGVLNLQTLELHFVSAGHTSPCLLRANLATELPQVNGPALGLAHNIQYPSNYFSLQAGDRLAVYTDGIDEAFNARDEMFTFKGLQSVLKDTGNIPIEEAGARVFQAVDDFAGSTPQSDDITLMLIDLPLSTTTSPRRTSQSFPCGTSAIAKTTVWLRREFERLSISEALGADLLLVAEEVITNINKYAQLPPLAPITVVLISTQSHVTLEFSDAGIAFNPFIQGHRATLGADIDSAEIGGLGVHLITKLTDERSYSRINGQNCLSVSKSFAGDSTLSTAGH